MKNILYILGILLLANSCRKKDNEIVDGPSLNDLYGPFEIITGLSLSHESINFSSDGDLILHHVDTFSNRNAFITDEGYMIFTDGEYWESGYVLDDYVQTDF